MIVTDGLKDLAQFAIGRAQPRMRFLHVHLTKFQAKIRFTQTQTCDSQFSTHFSNRYELLSQSTHLDGP